MGVRSFIKQTFIMQDQTLDRDPRSAEIELTTEGFPCPDWTDAQRLSLAALVG
jgi:hypothetical protein